MIYLDVTSSCKSPIQTGVQRMVRGLWRSLSEQRPVIPLIWSPKLQSYCRLSRRETILLRDPFRASVRSEAHPEKLSSRLPGVRWWRHLIHWRNRLAVDQVLSGGDILLVPEIFQDNRSKWFFTQTKSFQERKVRCVAVFHDAITWTHPELTPPNRQKGFTDYMRSLSGFDAVICVSEQSRADLERFWHPQRNKKIRTAVLPWPVDFEGKRPDFPKENSSPVILTVGTLEPRKNHLRLLEACERLWDGGMNFRLVLIGRAINGCQPDIPCRIRELQKAGSPVEWLRHVDDQTLQRTYEEACFTIYPSLVEGFGLPVLESLWFRRPCICSGTGAIGEVARAGGCLTIDPSNSVELKQAIHRLLTDGQLHTRLCDEISKRRFRSWDEYMKDLGQLLD